MNQYMLDLGQGILVRGSQVTAVLPLWMLETSDLEMPEGTPPVTCWVELEGGRIVPCFQEQEELLKFVKGTNGPQLGGFGGS